MSLRLALGAWLLLPSGAARAAEDRFDVLQIGAQTYTNVTVTTKAKNYIFLLHAGGLTNVKITELSPELREQLGYAAAGGPKRATNSAAVWAKREMAKINVPQLAEFQQQLNQKRDGKTPLALSAIRLIGPTIVLVALGIALLVHLFYCYCCMLICRKTGNPGGILVWLPVLQIFPLLRAAGMSGWWFLAFFVPILNLVPALLWPFKIAKARGKSAWVGLFLLLPVIGFFAFLYLAFSNGGASEEEDEKEPEIMTLATA